MKPTLTILFSFFFVFGLMAQPPEEMSFQTIVRDAGNNLLTNTQIGMQISILEGSSSGSSVYVETHTPTTNVNGLASIGIGSGTVVSGTFSSISWSSNSFFLKTEIDPAGGTNYTVTATSQMLTVPYAMHSKTAANGMQVVTLAQRNAITGQSVGDVVMQTDEYPGLYYWEGTAWRCLSGECPITFIQMGTNPTSTPPGLPILLTAAHHTLYVTGEWLLSDLGIDASIIELPDPTTCKGRTYKIVVNNYTTTNPPQGDEYGDGVFFVSTISGFSSGFSYVAISPTLNTSTPDEIAIGDGRMTIVRSNGTYWYQVQGDKIESDEF